MDAKLNQSDLISLMAKESNISAAKAEMFTKAFFDIIIEGLEQDGIVKINGLGTFKVTDVASRSSVDVNTGEKIEIKGHKKLTFTPADALKDEVNQPFAMFEPVEVDDTYQPDVQPEDSADAETNEEITEEPVATDDAPQAMSVAEAELEQPVEEAANEEGAQPLVTEETAAVEEPQQEQPTETVEEKVDAPEQNVAPQERPAEPVLVRVPKKKQPETKAVKKPRKRAVWRYIAVAVVVIAAAFAGFTMMTGEEKGAENSNSAATAENLLADNNPTTEVVAQVTEPNNDAPVAAAIEETTTTATVVDETPEQLPEPADDAVAEQPIAEEAVVEQPASDAVVEQPSTDAAEQTIAEDKYEFVMVQELASTRLGNITLADTLLYVADGELALHTVAADETLTKIARKYFGDKKLWPYIVKYNNMAKPDALREGMEIRIPRLIPNE